MRSLGACVAVMVLLIGSGCSSGPGGADGGGGVSCGDAACAASQVCVRTQTVGGALLCPQDGGTCPAGTQLSGQCCVMIPAWSCAARPAGCGASVTCACAAATLCTSGHTCTMPREGEIDCTLLAP